jgi:hypothetical protein
MGNLAGRTIMHFSDGSTLTDKDVYPHRLTEEQVESLTSVERVVRGWHISILKSECVRNFFIMTEAYQNLVLSKPGIQAPPPKISMRTLGCYLVDSDPPVRISLSMDPRTLSVVLKAQHVNKFRPDGFAKPLEKDKRKLTDMVQRSMDGCTFMIQKTGPVRRVFGTKEGMGCLIGVNKKKRVMAELRQVGTNVQLLIQPG